MTRFDCAGLWRLRTRGDVRSYLRALERQAKCRYGRPVTRGGAVRFGKNPRPWALMAYSKGDQLDTRQKGHRLSVDIPIRERL